MPIIGRASFPTDWPRPGGAVAGCVCSSFACSERSGRMIGRLRGTLAEKQPPFLLLDVNGVGYELEVPMTTLYRLPPVGEALTLHTHLVVREDAQLLYGFAEKRERELFRELIRLNGVGPKLALALMSGLEVDELVRCVQAQDTAALTKIPGVGKKTAERLLVELKDRFKAWEAMPGI